MDKAPLDIALLPFEEFLFELKEQHNFVLGVDSYERVNRVLNRYKEGESPDVKRLQYELCSILAASEEEQLIFDRTFEGFLGRYIFEVKAAEHDPALDISKKISRTRWGFRGFSLLLALLAIYGYFSFFYVKIIPEPIVAQLPGSYDMFWRIPRASGSCLRSSAIASFQGAGGWLPIRQWKENLTTYLKKEMNFTHRPNSQYFRAKIGKEVSYWTSDISAP